MSSTHFLYSLAYNILSNYNFVDLKKDLKHKTHVNIQIEWYLLLTENLVQMNYSYFKRYP